MRFNYEKKYNKVDKKNKILSMVISTVIATFITNIISKTLFNFKFLNWIYKKCKIILKISVPIWFILIFIIAFLILKKVYKNYSSGEIPYLDPKNYKVDKIFGVICEFKPNAKEFTSVVPYCPKCLYRLDSKGIDKSLFCENYGFSSDKEVTYKKINFGIQSKIEHKIKTGEYKKVIGKEAEDFLETGNKSS